MYSTLNGIKKFLKKDPIVVRAGLKTGINLRMENPKEMGTDRIVNLVAAYELYGGPAIVVDYETATTFDVVSEKGEFLTGMTIYITELITGAIYTVALFYWIKNEGDPDGHR